MTRDKRSVAQSTAASVPVPPTGIDADAWPATQEASAVADAPAADAEASSTVAATLVAIDGDLKGKAFVLANGENHLGRGADCFPLLNSRWISRSHARVTCGQGRVFMCATAGKDVFVNDTLVMEEALLDGDRIRLGTTVFLLRMVAGTGEIGGSAIPVIAGRTGSFPVPNEAELSNEEPGEARLPSARRKRPFWRFWQKPVPSLVFARGPRAGERIDLDKPRIRIGGLNDNDIVIHGNDASRNHAELRVRGGRAHIWDLRSVSGTWVNEQRIEDVELKFGDVIRIGSEALRFED